MTSAPVALQHFLSLSGVQETTATPAPYPLPCVHLKMAIRTLLSSHLSWENQRRAPRARLVLPQPRWFPSPSTLRHQASLLGVPPRFNPKVCKVKAPD